MKKKTLVLVCVFAAFINAVFCQNTQTNEKGIAQSDEEIMDEEAFDLYYKRF